VDRLGHVKCVKFNTNFLTAYVVDISGSLFIYTSLIISSQVLYPLGIRIIQIVSQIIYNPVISNNRRSFRVWNARRNRERMRPAGLTIFRGRGHLRGGRRL